MASLAQRDLAAVWHPATHAADQQRLGPIPITRAQGSWLYDERGRPILDGISSWWTSVHGHCHPEIVRAIAEQAATLDHVLLAGCTHEPAVGLAERLLRVAPGTPHRVFFADCGSAAIEVALKMSYQAHRQCGAPQRCKFAALRGSYHGETLGALSVSGHDEYRAMFSDLLPEVLYLPRPQFADHGHESLAQDLGASSPELEQAIALLRAHQTELAALIVEPLVQCAGRMAMTGTGFYAALAAEAQKLGIHVIADEIAVGFGRTGRCFASDWCDAQPDFLCLSKGLSGGVMPLACVVVPQRISSSFEGSLDRTFLHSHTYTGNPLACAAANASFDLLDDALECAPQKIAALERARQEVADACGVVSAHRQAGFIVAFDLDPLRGKRQPEGNRVSLAIREAGLRHGVLLRPLHTTLYWMPPLSISAEEVGVLARTTIQSLQDVFG